MADTRSRPPNRGDIVINGVKYPLFDDPKRGLAWWREGGVDNQEGSPEKPVAAVWDRGWRGGMGETKRLAPDSMGYAFSKNMDCTADGYARLSARPIAVTPTNSPGDAKTYFATKSSAGTAVWAVGSFVKDTTVGTVSQAVTHGLSVAPKAFIFWTAGETVSGTVGAGARACVGISDGTTHRAASWNSQDNVATTNAARWYAAAAIALIDASGSANQPSATLSAIGTTTFSVDWINNDATADIIHFMAIGGSDVSAKVTEWTMPTSNGNKTVSGVGFKPTTVIHLTTSQTALGVSTHAMMSMGMMDDAGNMGHTQFSSKDAVTPSVSSRHQRTDLLLQGTDANGTLNFAQNFMSMDTDGFTVYHSNGGVGAALQASLSLKGIRAKVGSFTKATGAAPVDQGAQAIGFTTTAFLLASTLALTTTSATTSAAFAMGAASGTTAVEASAWFDEHNVNPSDSYGLDDTALAFEKIDATGAENATATCANIDMEQAGWINWGVNDAVATQILYIAFAPLAAGTQFIYAFSGQRSWKMSVASNVITVEQEKDFGNNAVLGKPDTFAGLLYLPAGGSVVFQELTTVAVSGGTDTWTAAGSGLFATAFCGSQDGATAKLLRAYPTNLVKLAATAPRTAGSWASSFEVGDSSSAVVEALDTGVTQYVSKTDGLYRFATPGIATKVPITTSVDADGGVGLIGVQGTEVCFVSYSSGLWCVDGENARAIGPDTIRSNEAIPNIAYEPFRGRHYENAMFGRWLWSLYRVTESDITVTYILAGYIHRLGAQPVIEWHTPFMLDGAARGLGIFQVNGKVTIWTQVGGQFSYRVIGQDGSPNAGRDAIGYGAASTQYQLFLPLTDVELPHTTKQLRVFEIKARNLNANTPIQLQVSRNGGTFENVGATITASGVSKRYWTLGSNDTVTDTIGLIDLTTGAGYSNTTDDPQIWGAVIRAVPVPDHAGIYTAIIDTGARYKDGAEPPPSTKKMRDDLISLTTSSAVACKDSDGNTINMKMLEVKDAAVMQDANGAVKYVLELTMAQFVNA